MASKKIIIEPGDRHGRLLVIEEVRVQGRNRTRRGALCKCDCGSLVTVLVGNLARGDRSCGCLVAKRTSERNHRHGLYGHPLFGTWANMIYRCTSPKSPSYQWYGALGVKVCQAWQDPATFIEYIEGCLGPRPSGHSLDRIDPFGNYEPGNVRWASASEQTRNTRKRAAA